MTAPVDDPWGNLELPPDASRVTARRVDPALPWSFYWARSAEDRYLLILRHDQEPFANSLPRLRGIDVAQSGGQEGEHPSILWVLQDAAQRDIFFRLCSDIVESTATATSETEAIAIAVTRTWRWHHLLRGGGSERLGPEEQKGLIGELLCLERRLLPVLHARDAVQAWIGPLDAPKDFELAFVCIEAKARRGGATPHVAISSESQLDSTGIDALFLHVVDLDQAPPEAPGAFTVTSVVTRIRDHIGALDAGVLELYESRLEAAGFRWADDYSDSWWVDGGVRLYRVTEGFPRISASQLDPGVTRVHYAVSLNACEPYRVDEDLVAAALEGAAANGS